MLDLSKCAIEDAGNGLCVDF